MQIQVDVLSEEELWDLYAVSERHLVLFARRFTTDQMVAEDVVADVFIAVLALVRKGQGPTQQTFISYMRTSIRNTLSRKVQKASREISTADINDIVERGQDAQLDFEVPTTWDADCARRALRALPAKAQEILQLTVMQGESMSAVAKNLGISTRAAVMASFRARDALRTRYLVEIIGSDGQCASMKVEYLAAYVRGSSSDLRRARVEQHIEGCAVCAGRVKKMKSYRLPAAVIVGLATVGKAQIVGSGTVPAVAMKPSPAAPSLSHFLAAAKSNVIKIGVVVLACVTVGAFGWLNVRPNMPPVVQETSPRSSEKSTVGQKSVGEPSASELPTRQPSPSQLPSQLPTPKMDSGIGAEDKASDTISPAEQGTFSGRQAESLPPGVRSVNWRSVPNGYADGAAGVALLLSIVLDEKTAPSEYVIEVDVPAGVRLVNASASCSITPESARCVPGREILELRDFNLQYIVDSDGSQELPSFSLSTP